MKTKKELVEFLIKDYYDKKTNTVDLSDLDFGKVKVKLSGMKAETIYNDNQKANEIWNSFQQATIIWNQYQQAIDTIINNQQSTKGINND